MTASQLEDFDMRVSDGTTYSQDCQDEYIVDIDVAASGSDLAKNIFGRPIRISGGFAGPAQLLTESNCASASEDVTIRKRTYDVVYGWSAWQTVHNQAAQGTWVTSTAARGPRRYCALSQPYIVFAPVTWVEYDQYRVFVRPQLAGRPLPAFVAWEGE